MINLIIGNSRIENYGDRWYVGHPSNGAILAYCTTEVEAIHCRDELNALAERLREDSE